MTLKMNVLNQAWLDFGLFGTKTYRHTQAESLERSFVFLVGFHPDCFPHPLGLTEIYVTLSEFAGNAFDRCSQKPH